MYAIRSYYDQTLAFILQPAILPDLPHPHVGIADNVRRAVWWESFVLYLTCQLDSCTNSLGGFSQSITAQLFIIHTRHFDMNIDPIQHGTGNALLVFGNDNRRTPTGFLWIKINSAGAGMYTIRRVSLAQWGIKYSFWKLINTNGLISLMRNNFV